MSVPSKNELGIECMFRFTPDAIKFAPNGAGVFIFYDEKSEAILIGSTQKSVQKILTDHWKGREGGETCGAAYVGFEEHNSPLDREAELMELHRKLFGRLPRKNVA